ncbi:hypothetical protein [Cytobacillus firmus]|uniref:hypothetical protein n=1 Tax=Cytobacillus firmus TaxID=1399 RepID=UPI001C8E193F|nr:hypothetical protein [Cytobacillus firmus]MBX9973780.1 hypothetical protein [Cytobacillus firmus]
MLTGCRVREDLNREEVDLENRTARVVGKGGYREIGYKTVEEAVSEVEKHFKQNLKLHLEFLHSNSHTILEDLVI